MIFAPQGQSLKSTALEHSNLQFRTSNHLGENGFLRKVPPQGGSLCSSHVVRHGVLDMLQWSVQCPALSQYQPLTLTSLGYDAGIMTVILADKQFIEYYGIDATKSGVVATIPWATTGLAQLCVGGTLANMVGRLWALRISICFMCIGVVVQVVPNSYGVLILGRLITGLGFGCVYIASNLYVAECAPRMLRGSFVGTVSQFG